MAAIGHAFVTKRPRSIDGTPTYSGPVHWLVADRDKTRIKAASDDSCMMPKCLSRCAREFAPRLPWRDSEGNSDAVNPF